MRGWDVAQKREVVAVAPAATTSADAGRRGRPPRWRRRSTAPVRAAGTVASADQAQCDARATAARRPPRRRLRRAGGRGARQPRAAGRRRRSRCAGVGSPFDGQLHAERRPARVLRRTPATVTTFTVGDASERSLYGVASSARGSGRPRTPGRASRRWSPTSRTPRTAAGSRSSSRARRHLRDGWARTVQPGRRRGPRRRAAARGRRRGARRVRQGDLEHPYVLGGLYNGKDKPDEPGGPRRRHRRRGAAPRVRLAHRDARRAPREARRRGARCSAPTAARRRSCSCRSREAGIEIVSEGPVTVTAKKECRSPRRRTSR